ncbi:hypothetical protein AOQ84DRAFT_186957 [Glonium stellatum]|uniref:Uncharacterized protein n=1 Tax=Glonium stellatum TaxID=574774 RepID=A0A8E2F6N3_9PEZI|nr:hypothetical protein AOQ84DRAFT_186957 [Glonium stellatum]
MAAPASQELTSRLPGRPPSHGRIMRRTDSGFDEHQPLELGDKREHQIRHDGVPTSAVTRRSRSLTERTKGASHRPSVDRSIEEGVAKQKSHSHDRRRPGARRASVSSSSGESTPKPRGSRQSSKQSSHRASTAPDMARPAPPRRIISTQTVPTSTRDVDDVLALHYRSCSLFRSASAAGAPEYSTSLSGRVDPDPSSPLPDASSAVTPPSIVGPVTAVSVANSSKSSDEITVNNELPDTIIHWTSPSTRRREYAEIDRSHKGVRGFLRKVTPRWCSGSPSQPFYNSKDNSDLGSVRRYRLDLPDPEPEDDEKNTTALQGKPSAPRVSRGWNCF